MTVFTSGEKFLGLKIDVDTYVGMKRGVPRLLSIMKDFGISGTFYLSMGPDASGRAIIQMIRNPLFLKKMLRTRARRLYGWRTALYGTLLPSPMIGLSFPDLVRRIFQEGHEAEFHAWDHRRWQDELKDHSVGWIEEWFEKGVNAFRRVTGREPQSFGAPAWLIDERVLEVVRRYPFRYLSCTRATEPFIHDIAHLMEIPSNLPCLEEIGVEQGVATVLRILETGGLHVLPVHAEAEGGVWDGYFIRLIEGALKMGFRLVALSQIRDLLRPEVLPVRGFRMVLLPGRSVPCAV